MKKIYKSRHTFNNINDEQAQVIGEFFEGNFTGPIHPSDILDLAKSEDSPIHKYFEWDDSKAAHEHRLWQARALIKCIVTEIKGQEVPAFQNVVVVSEVNNRGYLATETCMETPDIWDQVIRRALTEASNWADRYRTYKELASVVEAIDKVKKEILGVKNEEITDTSSRKNLA